MGRGMCELLLILDGGGGGGGGGPFSDKIAEKEGIVVL